MLKIEEKLIKYSTKEYKTWIIHNKVDKTIKEKGIETEIKFKEWLENHNIPYLYIH
ncbi:MAG: hypothetical protein QXI33_01015 [Candidatus Pacearchaeota archaeon]